MWSRGLARLRFTRQAGNSGRSWPHSLETEFLLLWETSALKASCWLDETPPPPPPVTEDNSLLYLQSADCRCEPRVQSSFPATPRLAFDEITGHYLLAKLMPKTNHLTSPIMRTAGLLLQPDHWPLTACRFHLGKWKEGVGVPLTAPQWDTKNWKKLQPHFFRWWFWAPSGFPTRGL